MKIIPVCCQYCKSCKQDNKYGARNTCRKTRKRILNIHGRPSWCPLPDYKEPVQSCPDCNGKGECGYVSSYGGTYLASCSKCKGTGYIYQDNSHEEVNSCTECKGSGFHDNMIGTQIESRRCPTCKGTGIKPKEPQVENPYTRYYNDPDSPDGKSETTLYRVWQEGYEAGRRSK